MNFDITLLFYDNPISRSYVNVLNQKKIKIKKIIYLIDGSYYLIPAKFKAYLNFHKNNFWPLQFIRKQNILDQLSHLETSLKLKKNFFKKMYDFNEVFKLCNDITYIYFKNFKDNVVLNEIKKTTSEKILFSGGGILPKEFFEINKKFIHIHPGYLPNQRGADGVLWSIFNENNIGISSFFMNENIDEGEILFREKYDLIKLEQKYFNEADLKTRYRFIFSFYDPLFRALHLEKYFEKICNSEVNTISNMSKEGRYFSFMSDENKEELFKKLFS